MKRLVGGALAAIIALAPIGVAAEPVGPKLTDRLKELLADEMQQVAQATADISVAIAAGDHETVMTLGIKVRDSFILKQSLTDQDKKDLMGAVPPEFLAMDKRFHGLAGKMAHAAEAHDSELQAVYYAKMLETCVTCHSHFAADRFTGFAAESGGGHDH